MARSVLTFHGKVKIALSYDLVSEGVCFPETIDDLKPILELGTETGIQHLNVQPNVRPRTVKECIPLLEGWTRLSERADFPVYIATQKEFGSP